VGVRAPEDTRRDGYATIEQQETLDRESKEKGMTPAQIRRFIDYFYKDSWQPGLSAPTPPREATSFWAVVDARHRSSRYA